MKITLRKGAFFSFIIFFIIAYFFISILPKTPVILLRLSSHSGLMNFAINMFCFMLFTFIICYIFSLFINGKEKFLKECIWGILIAVILSYLLVTIILVKQYRLVNPKHVI